MSGKRFVIVLIVLGVVSFGVSAALSVLLGKSDKPPAVSRGPAPPKTRAEALLADLSAGQEAAQASPKQRELEELIKELRTRMAEYERKDYKLQERDKRLALAEENLRKRAREVDNLRMELVGPLARLRTALADLERNQVRVGKEELANIKIIAAKFEKMDTAQGGGILSVMCQNNQAEDVVKILYYMSERVSARMLSEMTDKELAARLTGMMQKLKQEG